MLLLLEESTRISSKKKIDESVVILLTERYNVTDCIHRHINSLRWYYFVNGLFSTDISASGFASHFHTGIIVSCQN